MCDSNSSIRRATCLIGGVLFYLYFDARFGCFYWLDSLIEEDPFYLHGSFRLDYFIFARAVEVFTVVVTVLFDTLDLICFATNVFSELESSNED